MAKTLEEYLRSLIKDDLNTYEVNFKITGATRDRLTVLLHPVGKDGETVDFVVKGNKLEPRFHENGMERILID